MGTEEFNGFVVASSILSTMLDTQQRFGINYVVSILVGSKSLKVIKYKHDVLPTHGALKDYSFEQIKVFVKELIENGFIEQTKGEYPVLVMLNKGKLALEGKEQVTLSAPDPNLERKLSALKGESVARSLTLFKEGKSVEEIANERNLAQATILSHLATAYSQGEDIDIDQFISSKKLESISQAFKKYGTDFLTPVKNSLGLTYTWEDLKLVRAKLIREQESKQVTTI